MSNHIVIGANFGDEGKGLVTGTLAQELSNSIVIRFNGGAQAGHTVELSDGRKHEFHSLGSGTLHGRDTLLSEYFIVNPQMFIQEVIEVPQDHFKVFAHRNAMLTTPYDWILNQSAEEVRGAARHGTCGMGINETVTRMYGGVDGVAFRGYGTKLGDIFDIKSLRERLKVICDYYVPLRAKQRGITDYTYIQEYDVSDYVEYCELMSSFIVPVSNYNILKHYRNKIFEGAQGLLLDEMHYFYPHVTRSRTGIHNATKILSSIGEEEADVNYVTRSYTTRHGEGPLYMEGLVKEKEDLTNGNNVHQGKLRFAPLNLILLRESITNDLTDNHGLELNPILNVTWAQYYEDIVLDKEPESSNFRDNLIHTSLPFIKESMWYRDKYIESKEKR